MSASRPLRILLISTYDLGRQPFGLASPAAWLREAGHRVGCQDLDRHPLRVEEVMEADLVAFHLPMHTATRLAVRAAERVRELRPALPLCFYGLYAPPNGDLLRGLGGPVTLLGGEFEPGLVALASALAAGRPEKADLPLVHRGRIPFRVPDREGLPELAGYAGLRPPGGGRRTVGYTEASRGCKHLCRHCPVVPIYQGLFRTVPREVVVADIRQQVEAGAHHITFGDPDFFNGVGHAVAVAEELGRDFPDLTFDVTIKVDHLLKHADRLPGLAKSGCLFVTSAVESTDDRTLRYLAKGHSGGDFERAARLCHQAGLGLSPTFIPFTPWTTWEGYLDLLATVARLGLVEAVAPVQYTIRLLIPAGSYLLDVEEIRDLVDPLDHEALAHPWRHRDPAIDAFQREVSAAVVAGHRTGFSRRPIFRQLWILAHRAAGRGAPPIPEPPLTTARAAIPYLEEPWYC